MMILFQRFNKAFQQLQMLKSRPTREELLECYGLYKQGTIGDVDSGKNSRLGTLLKTGSRSVFKCLSKASANYWDSTHYMTRKHIMKLGLKRVG